MSRDRTRTPTAKARATSRRLARRQRIAARFFPAAFAGLAL